MDAIRTKSYELNGKCGILHKINNVTKLRIPQNSVACSGGVVKIVRRTVKSVMGGLNGTLSSRCKCKETNFYLQYQNKFTRSNSRSIYSFTQEAPAVCCTESITWALSWQKYPLLTQRLIWREKKVACVVKTTCCTSSVDLLQFDCLNSRACAHNATHLCSSYITINMCSTRVKTHPERVLQSCPELKCERWQKWLRTAGQLDHRGIESSVLHATLGV